ncbi:MAG: hypothetical protein WC179_00575 [Candidatus Cloacimonadaceae bacterium]|jgi:hypothetical protein|nr:hypothetical protein [Candidatus Cloacimonadota bacterium]MDD5624551.1 hypothetical protein [Candidatus Cloacimonadota bacterium]MDY0111659.1 hypothetical protein [Candidatus Syntrophosphaera sp.]
MLKRFFVSIAIVLGITFAVAKVKPLNFENPGNRRLLKTEEGNYWYYRSLPEKSMFLNVEGISTIYLRSFSVAKVRKPQVIIIFGKDKKTYDLSLKEQLDGFYIYDEITISIPEGASKMELLCYERSIYFRPFYTPAPTPKPKSSKPPNLVVKAHGGIINISHNNTESQYYTFNSSQSFKFTLNNGRNAIVYVRARLHNNKLPVFELYRNGELVDIYEFTLQRSTKYKATGVNYLSLGKKIDLPANSGTVEYELRAKTDHMFFAKPVLLKQK